ncbi:S9 family peptidase [Peristeroidobacter soli]|uniref:S9 family peptidase n=1 Tax=Peristeroidobacter soli TaxID=2497877 RepID=UPI00101B6F9A|nr:prolyl oligopeptidase family serine peptidase [Peristeroidobacter soli]
MFVLQMVRRAVVMAALTSIVSIADAAPAAQRPVTLEDTYRLEGLGTYYGGPVAFAPDGKSMAFTRRRSDQTVRDYTIQFLWDNDRADVWVKTPGAAEPVNVTRGAEDGSGWWSPVWSPDGRYLAMLSTRGPVIADNVWLWVWDSRTNTLRRLSERGVDIDGKIYRPPHLWLDAGHVLCPLLPEGGRPIGLEIERQSQRIAAEEWPKTRRGEQSTVSVLDSGVPVDVSKRPQGRLVRFDVRTGEASIVADRSSTALTPSPRGEYIAYGRQVGVSVPQAGIKLIQSGKTRYTIDVVDLSGRRLLTAEKVASDARVDAVRWSPRGDRVVFTGFAEGGDGSQRIYVGTPARGTVEMLELGPLDTTTIGAWWVPPQIEWTADGALLIRAAERLDERATAPDARRDWWRVSLDGKRRNLTKGMAVVPEQFWAERGRASFVGLAKEELWRLQVASGRVSRALPAFGEKIERIVWPATTNDGLTEYAEQGHEYDDLVLGIRRAAELQLHRVDLAANRVAALATPAPKAELLSYSPRSGQAAFYANDGDGLRLWLAPQGAPTQLLIDANGFLRDLIQPERRLLEYTSLDGDALKGWLLLPVGYEKGRRYPLITSVYAGSVYSEVPPSSLEFGRWLSAYSPQIWAARGYAVLLPSMPLNPWGKTDDPMLKLPNGVLPAVDAAVATGVADPKRLFVMGGSFGGFSTYGLLTQTRRFAGGVALAGLSNLISLYGQFDARRRYASEPQEFLSMMQLMESGQTAMGSPPWEDLNRYLRNSPIFAVDRVETPLMIVQGDMDYVAIQQGEEFFNALYRQGKRARFVRYWGEGHGIQSPANSRDLLERIQAWFEEVAPPLEEAG